jgi:hypothetical protein
MRRPIDSLPPWLFWRTAYLVFYCGTTLMKIVTWNMSRRHQEAGWAYLLNEINPDIALLQEVYPPDRFKTSHLLYTPIGGSRNWGSAVYTSNFPIREVRVERYRGWVAAGVIQLHEGFSIIAVSIHAQIIKNYVFPNLTWMSIGNIKPLFPCHPRQRLPAPPAPPEAAPAPRRAAGRALCLPHAGRRTADTPVLPGAG